MQTPDRITLKPVSLALIFGFLIPQSLLLILNTRAWALIGAEANREQAVTASLVLVVALVMLAVFALLIWLSHQRCFQVGWKLMLFSLLVHVIAMWLFLAYGLGVIPDSIQPWILNEGNVGRWTITLLMPGAFLSLYALTNYFFSRVQDSLRTPILVSTVLGAPVIWYLFVVLLQPFWLGQFTVVISIVIATLIVVAFLGSIIRLFDHLAHKNSVLGLIQRHNIFAALLGVAAPIAGLSLNHTISFPVDFQDPAVYLFTLLNGAVLMLKPGVPNFIATRLFLRCLTFPFIAYFFIVFLPFLPLSLLAIMVVGMGFLMLTPLALGLFQSQVTLQDFHLASDKLGRKKALGCCFAGLLVLPMGFYLEALLDKRALDTSLDYFYSHDLQEEGLTVRQMSRSAKALIELHDRKAGLQLPYLSAFYNSVVFGDLVLTDAKIARLYRLLTNQAPPRRQLSVFGNFDNNRRRFFRPQPVAPNRDVIVQSTALRNLAPGQVTLRLNLLNQTSDVHSLFVGDLALPEGVFVTGLRLKIGDEWVSGRIFDRKTAQWVFQKITEVRRDPALLYYKTSGLAELRLYPFPASGLREVELDFDFHPQMNANISLRQQSIDLNPDIPGPSIASARGVLLDAGLLEAHALQRSTYLHVILDYSKESRLDTADYVARIVAASEQLGISRLKVTAANITLSKPFAGEFLDAGDRDTIMRYIDSIQLPEAGGLWLEQALASEMMRYHESISDQSFQQRPVFAVLEGRKKAVDQVVALDQWHRLIPDMQRWYRFDRDGLRAVPISSETGLEEGFTKNVVALKINSKLRILAARQNSIVEAPGSRPMQIFDPETNRFVFTQAVPQAGDAINPVWPELVAIWIEWRNLSLNPAHLESARQALLGMSRGKGMLIPTTSLIAVEAASQWEMLQRKEAQSLKNHSGLEFEGEQQTSEPPWWLLLAGLLAYLYYRRIRA
ncbi:MAG: MSEP-CTERM sorting domain-containing protein [Gammaproteobacteria bacterium]|nr:MSEP-CTERM sorting domain-containing protein [Gammaproteobacteria bacterium]